MQYRVLPGREWFSLAKVYKAGEVVELPETEGAPFVGRVLELAEAPSDKTGAIGSAPVLSKPAKKLKKAKP